MRPLLKAALCAAILAAPASEAAAQSRARLLVYTTLVPEFIDSFKQGFEAEHRDIEIAWHRDSTGTLTAKLIAERETPRADFVWGLAITSMILLAKDGLLDPYAPRTLAEIKPLFRDKADPPAWVGMEAWAAAICFNTIEAKKLGLPAPRSWQDLTDPAYRGRIVMPNPASSGTGFLHVSGWLQIFGAAKGWALMDGLHRNIAVYTHSGSKPCRQAAQGEYPIGIAYELIGAQAKGQGAPIDVLIMKEGGGWEMDAAGIVRGTKHRAAAERLADWAASRRANELYARYATLVAFKGIQPSMPHYPAGVEDSLIDNDFAWAAANRARILEEWQKRYDGKSEKRN
jgi:iron(III) transport system substrate-binding protein